MDERPSFWRELHRRRVWRTTLAYAVLAFVAIQLLAGLADYYEWPGLIVRAAIWFGIIGGIAVAIVSWIYDWTPWGVFKTGPVGEPPRRKTGLIDYRIEAVIILALMVALGFAIRFTFDEFAAARTAELESPGDQFPVRPDP